MFLYPGFRHEIVYIKNDEVCGCCGNSEAACLWEQLDTFALNDIVHHLEIYYCFQQSFSPCFIAAQMSTFQPWTKLLPFNHIISFVYIIKTFISKYCPKTDFWNQSNILASVIFDKIVMMSCNAHKIYCTIGYKPKDHLGRERPFKNYHQIMSQKAELVKLQQNLWTESVTCHFICRKMPRHRPSHTCVCFKGRCR